MRFMAFFLSGFEDQASLELVEGRLESDRIFVRMRESLHSRRQERELGERVLADQGQERGVVDRLAGAQHRNQQIAMTRIARDLPVPAALLVEDAVTE